MFVSTLVPLPLGYTAPRQTPPVVYGREPDALSFYFITIELNTGRKFVWAGNGLTGQLEGSGQATSAQPDKYGFYRNCMVSTTSGVYFAGPATTAISAPFEILLSTRYDVRGLPTGYFVSLSLGASEFVQFTTLSNAGFAFVSWVTTQKNDLFAVYANATQVQDAAIVPSANATYLQGKDTAPYILYRTANEIDLIANLVRQRIFGIYTLGSSPLELATTDVEISKMDLVEAFISTPFTAFSNWLFLTDWGAPGSDPSVLIFTIRPAPVAAPVSTSLASSIVWFLPLSDTDIAFVGPTLYAANADEFINAKSFGAWRFNPPSITPLLSPNLGHVFTSFLVPPMTYYVWGQQTENYVGPTGFVSVYNYKGQSGLDQDGLRVICPGRETWVHYARMLPVNNGSHAFFYAPSDVGPAFYTSDGIAPRALLNVPSLACLKLKIFSMRRKSSLHSNQYKCSLCLSICIPQFHYHCRARVRHRGLPTGERR
jgi:hypothetical protein